MASKLMKAVAITSLFSHAVSEPKDGWTKGEDEQGRAVQRMEIKAPAMTEEDQYGYNMPDRYRCDSCKAVVFHVNEALKRKQPKSRRLKSWEYSEIFDETCRSAFSGYGVSNVNDENKLSGPGLKMDTNVSPGMGAIQMGGESWEKRLGEVCRKFIYDKIGDDEVYELFRNGGDLLTDSVCYEETRDCRTGPDTAPEKGNKEKKGKKVKAQKKEKLTEAKAPPKPAEGASEANSKPVEGDDSIDIKTFLARLATEHGVTTAAYTKKRTQKEWEQLFIATAGQIFGRAGEDAKDIVNV